MRKGKALIIIILTFNLFFQLVDYSDTKTIFNDFQAVNEYRKRKILVDSIIRDDEILATSAEDLIIYQVYYDDMNKRLSIVDDSHYLFRDKANKANIVQFLEYHQAHNDSINIWHHPKYRDLYAKEGESRFSDTFNYIDITLKLFFFIVAILTLVYFLFKRLNFDSKSFQNYNR